MWVVFFFFRDEILDIIAMLSTDNIFVTSYLCDNQVQEIKRKYHASTGDHMTLLNVFRAFSQVKFKEVQTVVAYYF